MLSVVTLNVVMLSVVMLHVVMLSVIVSSVIMLHVIMMSVFMLRVVVLSVIMLNIVVVSTWAPSKKCSSRLASSLAFIHGYATRFCLHKQSSLWQKKIVL
jgi:hypothetical protein